MILLALLVGLRVDVRLPQSLADMVDEVLDLSRNCEVSFFHIKKGINKFG